MRVLFDNGTPRGVGAALTDHIVEEARAHGWDTFRNGELLDAAEAAPVRRVRDDGPEPPLPAEPGRSQDRHHRPWQWPMASDQEQAADDWRSGCRGGARQFR
jgi:hypothetical protein